MPDVTTAEKLNVGIGFALQGTIYSTYSLCGIILLAEIRNPDDIRGFLLQIFIFIVISILGALRTFSLLARSYYKFLRDLPTCPTRREIFVRIGLKFYLFLHGVIIFVCFSKSSRQAVKDQHHKLWIFYCITCWTNIISMCFLPFALKSSLSTPKNTQKNEKNRLHVTIRFTDPKVMSNFSKKRVQSLEEGDEDKDPTMEVDDLRLTQAF